MTKQEKLDAISEALDNNQAVKISQIGEVTILDHGYSIISWSVPNEEAESLILEVSTANHYREKLETLEGGEIVEINNPETREEFAKRMIEDFTVRERAKYNDMIAEEAKQAELAQLSNELKIERI